MNRRESRASQVALLLSLAIGWLNLLLTSRWAAVAGSINGSKRPYFVIALAAATVLACRVRPGRVRAGMLPATFAVLGCGLLSIAFFRWFPPSTWRLIPFLDDWPPRFQSTVDGVALLRQGAFTGWQWGFLGGYPTVTDITQDLTLWAALPMMLFGPRWGFHFVHLLLFAAVPVLIWYDLSIEEDLRPDVAVAAAGLAALFATNYSYFLVRSGDTNSLTGIVSTAATLVAAHAARAGRRWAAVVLPVALTVTYYSHRGFFLYALCFLTIDAAVAWDPRSVARAGLAFGTAIVAGLPVSWDLWRHPGYFIANNVTLAPTFRVGDFARQLYYNTEILFRPGRWFNDFTGLTHVLLPVIAIAAWYARGRVRTYALFTLGVVLMVRLNYAWFGYVFLRPIVLLPVFLAPVAAWLLFRRAGTRALTIALAAVFGLYIQMWLEAVPHVSDVTTFAPALVTAIQQAPGHLVLVENAFHRDVDVSAAESVPTPFPAHFEALLPAATGRLLYAGMWDGWQWTPYRDQLLASGTFRGHAMASVSARDLVTELRRWGVQRLFVWSIPAVHYLQTHPEFAAVARVDAWSEFELVAADARSIAVNVGSGDLLDVRPLSARVHLEDVAAGETVVVRTNYHPAWQAAAGGTPILLRDSGGQLAFTAPTDGTYEVALEYPSRRWLISIALSALILGSVLTPRLQPRSSRNVPASGGLGL